ncbi:MAG: RagB/SusD family nutrient uptake outer membrane protein [Bacteroidota bacterium]
MKYLTKKIVMVGSVLIVALLLPLSCSESLDQVNNNTVSTGSFWQNENDARLAVNGMFHPIANTFFWGRIVHTGAILRSDVFNIRPFGTNTTMSTFQGGPGTARWATEPYQELYKSIFRANAILENVNEENVSDVTARNEIIGQAHFMRAFDYWYLLHLYGNIPLVTSTPQSDEDFFPTQATPEAVYAQIESDLNMAAGMLPESWSDNDLGRPTSGSAIALLGKTQLYQEKWSEAATTFNRIVDAQYSLLPADQYEDNFTSVNEYNEEEIFSLQYVGQSSFAWGADIPGVGTLGTYHIDYAPPAKSPDQSHFINTWVRDLFEANGETVRRNATLAYDYPGSTGYGGLPYLDDFAGDILVAEADEMEPIFTRKYAGMDLGRREDVNVLGANVGNNWRIIRYADVLLMLAEALNESGSTSQAIERVNEVRRRAQVAELDTGMGQADARQAIIDERVLELTGESHRFFDLVRWGLADDYLGANSLHGDHPKSLSGGIFQSNKHELVWIPQSEIDANPNLVQNPGY